MTENLPGTPEVQTQTAVPAAVEGQSVAEESAGSRISPEGSASTVTHNTHEKPVEGEGSANGAAALTVSTPPLSKTKIPYLKKEAGGHLLNGRLPSHTAIQIDEAMAKANGNRKEAATILGLSYEQLKNRLKHFQWVGDKWSLQAVKKRAAQGSDVLDPVGHYFAEAYEGMFRSLNKIAKHRELLWSRIERHNEALASGDAERMAKDCFKRTISGDPAEERMVMTAYEHTFELERRAAVEYRIATQMRMDFVAKMGNRSNGNGPPKPGVGFRPKSALIHDVSP